MTPASKPFFQSHAWYWSPYNLSLYDWNWPMDAIEIVEACQEEQVSIYTVATLGTAQTAAVMPWELFDLDPGHGRFACIFIQ